jgi:hypothetical protein
MIDRIAVGVMVAGMLVMTIGFVINHLIVGTAGLILIAVGWRIVRR